MKKLTATPLAFMLIKSEMERRNVNTEPYAKIPERGINRTTNCRDPPPSHFFNLLYLENYKVYDRL